ncbi:MAG: hypothetical protein J7M01_03705 [Candidatus Marinimicrobia bacterium]|nr:hypothetical protein [Candidatus Neomarinimicrobiota bacterium]
MKKYLYRKTLSIVLLLVVLVSVMIFFMIIKRSSIISQANSLKSEALAVFSQSKEDNWYLDDYDRVEIFELLNELAYVENNTTSFDFIKHNFWLKRIDLRLQKVRSGVLYKTKLLTELKDVPEFISSDIYNAKIKEAKYKDELWESGNMVGGWEHDEKEIVLPSMPMRGYKLVNNFLVPCSFEEMVAFLYLPDGKI